MRPLAKEHSQAHDKSRLELKFSYRMKNRQHVTDVDTYQFLSTEPSVVMEMTLKCSRVNVVMHVCIARALEGTHARSPVRRLPGIIKDHLLP